MPTNDAKTSRKLALITGANTGIGFEAARGIAKAGFDIVFGCRDKSRGQEAIATLTKEFPNAKLDLLIVDLSDQKSIRTAAATFIAIYPNLDVLVNNAGIGLKTREVSVDGIELTFATNVLAYFLLTNLLLNTLRKVPTARVINVASSFAGGLDLTDLQFTQRHYDATPAYTQSKQANRMLTWALARRLVDSHITANAMTPGATDTRLLQTFVPGRVGKTPAQGADTIVWLATSPEVEGLSNRFWDERHEQPCQFRNEAQEEALWSICEDMTAANSAAASSN
jgi:retinol dehydrogenase 12